MDEFTDKQIRRIADNLERIANSLDKLVKPGAIVVENLDTRTVDETLYGTPAPVRTS